MATGADQTNAPNCGATGVTPPSGTIANSPSGEAGFAFMWHSHNEREITTNNAFPGGMMMMMLVDSREFMIDESNWERRTGMRTITKRSLRQQCERQFLLFGCCGVAQTAL